MSQGQTGCVPGTKWVCPRDKPRFSPYFTQWKPSLSPGQTQFVPGTFRGQRAAERVYASKVYVPFSFPTCGQHSQVVFWFLVDVSDSFYFFCSGERGRGSPRRRKGGGVGFLLKIREEGGGLPKEREGAEGPEGCLRGTAGGGGAKFFF